MGILTTYHPHAPKMPLSLNDSSKAHLPKILLYCVALAPYNPKSLLELLHMTNPLQSKEAHSSIHVKSQECISLT